MMAHPLTGRQRKLFVMLRAYMDDSGSHAGSPVSVIAGYFGGVRRWLEFEHRWKSALDREGILEFHARRFRARDADRNRVGDYRGWDNDRANAFKNRLLTAIEDSAVYPFACGVVAEEWKKQELSDQRMFTGATQKFPTGAPTKSIFLAFQKCVFSAISPCKPGIKVHFVFDQNPQTEAWATICYSEMKRTTPIVQEHGGDLTFSDSKDAMPLQAADLLAYEAHSYVKRFLTDPKTPIRMSYARALRNMRSRDDFWLFDGPRFNTLHRFRRPSS